MSKIRIIGAAKRVLVFFKIFNWFLTNYLIFLKLFRKLYAHKNFRSLCSMSASLWIVFLHLIKLTITHRPHLWDKRSVIRQGFMVSGLIKVKRQSKAGGIFHCFPLQVQAWTSNYVSSVLDAPVCLHVFSLLFWKEMFQIVFLA